jgi:hypothetical protein
MTRSGGTAGGLLSAVARLPDLLHDRVDVEQIPDPGELAIADVVHGEF